MLFNPRHDNCYMSVSTLHFVNMLAKVISFFEPVMQQAEPTGENPLTWSIFYPYSVQKLPLTPRTVNLCSQLRLIQKHSFPKILLQQRCVCMLPTDSWGQKSDFFAMNILQAPSSRACAPIPWSVLRHAELHVVGTLHMPVLLTKVMGFLKLWYDKPSLQI